MGKQLVKSKIVLEDDGKSLVVYLWKPVFLCFGYWYPFGSTSSNQQINSNRINNINDNEVSRVLCNKFLH